MIAVELDISSFRGSIGAEHFYGKFVVHYSCKHENNQTEVERAVDQAEADYLNKKDGNDPDYYWIKAGDMVNRFNSERELRDRAIEVFPTLFGNDAVLYYNDQYLFDCPVNGTYWENSYTPLYDPELAAAITTSGRASVRRMMVAMGYEDAIA